MLDGSTNLHHGVPRSFTGTNEDENLSATDIREHAFFHVVTGHQPPDFFHRDVLLSSVDWRSGSGLALPIGFYRDAIKLLLRENWQDCYSENTIRTESRCDFELFVCASIHIQNKLIRESYQAADALNFIRSGAHLSPRSKSFLKESSKFFGQHSPAGIMNEFMWARNGKGEYKWSKPVTPEFRFELHKITRSKGLEQPNRKYNRNLEELMQEYRRQLQVRLFDWSPNPEEYREHIDAQPERYPFAHFPSGGLLREAL